MYSGLTAKLCLENTVNNITTYTDVAYISNWSVEETRDIIEITKLGSKSKEKMPSLYGWSASADGTADFATNSAQFALREAMLEGKDVNVSFFLNENTDNGNKVVLLSGKALIESMSVDISAEDKGNISISLSGKGDLTLTVGNETQPKAPTSQTPQTPPASL